jgi:hypothetical protein
VYTRYAGRRYYNPNGTVLAHGGTSLHRQIWLDASREIPPGWHVHHKDEDLDHNELDNFECIDPIQHAKLHFAERGKRFNERAAHWRQSAAGKKVLRSNARKMLERTPQRTVTCGHCATEFLTTHPTRKHCSRACTEAMAGHLKDCEICGASFRVKPNNKKETRTCSYRCGWVLRKRTVSL